MAKEISRTLVIGLGGTGQTVIREIKKRLFRRYGEIPSLVKFLSFDTDDDEYQGTDFEYYYDGENRKTKKYNISKQEFMKLARPGLDVLRNDQNCVHLNFDQLKKIYSMANGIGANGFRVMGRAHFLYNSGNIMTLLVNTVAELQRAQLAQHELARGYNLAGNGITVYIIASVAGGTGSSAFLDLSRMLQHAGIDILPRGANMPSDNILGMFFMPSFFCTKPNTPNVRMNAYVALSELDYLLGLNDEEKYPEGCYEKENDQNDYANYKDYKSVRYTNVYLIDEKTKKGHSHSFGEAAGYVASFIAASIAANNQALNSCYSNSTHRLHDVEGKKQLYSGLGYCEVRFDRQNLVKYLLNKQLRDLLSEYRFASLDIDKIADEFIDANALNEGVMSKEDGVEDTRSQLNELTDAIYQLTDKRFAKPMARVETGKEAAAQIETNKVKYLNALDSELNDVIKAFAVKKKSILKNLLDMLSKRQSERGFGSLPDLVKRLKSAFEDMKLGLEDEIAKHEKRQVVIETELKKIKATINENISSGFLGRWGGQQQDQRNAIKSYADKVDNLGKDENPTLMRLKLEIARKNEAIDVYNELIKILDSFYKEEEVELGGDRKTIQVSGSVIEVQQSYDSLKRNVESEFLGYSYSKSAKNETIFVDAYFKEYFDTHKTAAFELDEQSKDELDQTIQNIFINKDLVGKDLLAKMREKILSLLPDNTLIKRILREELSLDQLFIHCFGRASDIDDDHDKEKYPHLGLFGQMNTLFDSLWQYDDFRGGNFQPVALQCVIGVNDIQNYLLDNVNGYNAYLPAGHHYQAINVGDPDRIIFILQETAIPAFKMYEASVWRGEFNERKESTYSFSDSRLEDIDMLFPQVTNEKGEIAWAYGWMFGILASVNQRIQVKASQAYLNRTQQVAGESGFLDYFAMRKQRASNLAVCFRQFVKDDVLVNDIYEQVMQLLDSNQTGSIVRIAHWVNDDLLWQNRGKLRSSMDEKERLVIQNEPVALAKRFKRLSTSMTGLSLNQLGKVEFLDSLGTLAEAERIYKENSEN